MSPTVRRATAEEIPALARLFVEFHNFHARGVPTNLAPVGEPDQELLQAVAKLLEEPTCAIFVACLEGEVVGFAEVYVKETNPVPALVRRRFAHLQSLAVTASQRRQGLGLLLIEAARQWAREKGATEMETETWEFPEGPLPFYEGLGFTTRKRLLVSPL